MRSVLAVFGIYVLALLLAGTFPVGAGDPVHGGALVHPAFPHTHTPAGIAAGAPTPVGAHAAQAAKSGLTLTPALDTSAGGATEVPSTAITPPVPRAAAGVFPFADARLIPVERPRPAGRHDPPPDPPPPTPFVFA